MNFFRYVGFGLLMFSLLKIYSLALNYQDAVLLGMALIYVAIIENLPDKKQ